jgi:two-component system LytT family response regulator
MNQINEVICVSKVMIVEDDIIIAKGLENIVQSMGKDIHITTTGYAKEALDYANVLDVDLFLLDIQLNDYSGYELAQQLRDIDRYKLTPIVFITAIPTRELMAFKEIHCYDYIVKPFKEEEVIEVVETLVNYGIKKNDEINYLSLVQKDYIYRVNIEEIIYMESIRGKIKLQTVKEEIILSNYTLIKLLEELSDDFVQCHRGFVINISYIEKMDKANNSIKLKNINEIIPIGRKFKDLLRSEIFEYN